MFLRSNLDVKIKDFLVSGWNLHIFTESVVRLEIMSQFLAFPCKKCCLKQKSLVKVVYILYLSKWLCEIGKFKSFKTYSLHIIVTLILVKKVQTLKLDLVHLDWIHRGTMQTLKLKLVHPDWIHGGMQTIKLKLVHPDQIHGGMKTIKLNLVHLYWRHGGKQTINLNLVHLDWIHRGM